MPISRLVCGMLVVLSLLPFAIAENPGRQYLRDWQIESSCKANAKGAEISTAAYQPQKWLPAKVPTTVVAAQLAAGAFDDRFPSDHKDAYWGTNLRKLPGMSYPVGRMFSILPMAD